MHFTLGNVYAPCKRVSAKLKFILNIDGMEWFTFETFTDICLAGSIASAHSVPHFHTHTQYTKEIVTCEL